MFPGRISFFILGCIVGALCLDFGRFSKEHFFIEPSNYTYQKVDCVVTLTGGAGRLAKAIDYLKEGRSNCVFVSGVNPDVKISEILKSNKITGVSKSTVRKIRLGKFAKSTRENADEIANFVKRYDLKSILLITSNYHIMRALNNLNDKVGDSSLVVYYEGIESPSFSQSKWWQNPQSFKIALREYAKSYF